MARGHLPGSFQSAMAYICMTAEYMYVTRIHTYIYAWAAPASESAGVLQWTVLESQRTASPARQRTRCGGAWCWVGWGSGLLGRVGAGGAG